MTEEETIAKDGAPAPDRPSDYLVPAVDESRSPVADTQEPSANGGRPSDYLVPSERPSDFLVDATDEEANRIAADVGPGAELDQLDARNDALQILPRKDWDRRQELLGQLDPWRRHLGRNIEGVGEALKGLWGTITGTASELWKTAGEAGDDPLATLVKLQATSVEGGLRGMLDFGDLIKASAKGVAGALDDFVEEGGLTDAQMEDRHYSTYVERQTAKRERYQINKDTALGTVAGYANLALKHPLAMLGEAAGYKIVTPSEIYQTGIKAQQGVGDLVLPNTADAVSLAATPMNFVPFGAAGDLGSILGRTAVRGLGFTAEKTAAIAGVANRAISFSSRAEALISRVAPNLSQSGVRKLTNGLTGAAYTAGGYTLGSMVEDATGNDWLKNAAFLYGATRAGLAATSAGAGVLNAIAKETAKGPLRASALMRLSRTPGTPVPLAATARILNKVATPVVRAGRAAAAGATSAAALNMGLTFLSGEEEPKIIGSGAVGAAIGAPIGVAGHYWNVLSGADRAVRTVNEIKATSASQLALNGPEAQARYDLLPIEDKARIGMIQSVIGPTGIVEVLGGDTYLERHGAQAGIHIEPGGPGILPRLVVNADAQRPPGQTLLHEFGHELASRFTGPEIKALFDEFATDEERLRFEDDYIARSVETLRRTAAAKPSQAVDDKDKEPSDTAPQVAPDHDPEGVGQKELIRRRVEQGATREEAMKEISDKIDAARKWQEDLPTGSVIKRKDGRLYTKESDGTFRHDDGSVSGGAHTGATLVEPEAAAPEAAPAPAPEPPPTPEEAAAVRAGLKTKEEWVAHEWFAEKTLQTLYDADWARVLAKGQKTDIAKWATLNLRTKRSALENSGVAFHDDGTVVDPSFISKSFTGQADPRLKAILYGYVKDRAEFSPVLDSATDHASRADEGKGPTVDFGKGYERVKTHPGFKDTFTVNPRTGLKENEFAVEMPDGSIVLKNPKDIQARDKAETAELQRIFNVPVAEPDSPQVAPKRMLDEKGQPVVRVSGQRLPDEFFESDVVSQRSKEKAKIVQDVMRDGRGETLDMIYNQIGSEGKTSWAAAVRKFLGNVRSTFRTVRPINFFMSNAGHLLARVIDVTAYNAKLLHATEDGALGEWNNNAELFNSDVHKVMSNWASGLPGSHGIETAKFIRIMDFMGKEGGRAGLIKSFRIDRMENVQQTGRGGWTFDYGKYKSRSAPSPSPSPAPDVTGRASPDVPGRPGAKPAEGKPEKTREPLSPRGATIKRDLGPNAEFAVPPSEAVIKDSLIAAYGEKGKVLKFGAARDLKPGTPIGTRIDIRAFNATGDYPIAIHEEAKNQKVEGIGGRIGPLIGHDTHVVMEGPGKFFVDEVTSEQIRTGFEKLAAGGKIDVKKPDEGRHKTLAATAEGKYAADQTVPADIQDWTPAGFDPRDHSYYYDKATDQMITGWKGKPGEPAAYSVGNTVFLKDPIYGTEAKRAAARYSPDVSNEGAGRQTTGNPEFYSALQEHLDRSITGVAMLPNDVMGIARRSGSGVKPDEIKWSGLEQTVQRLASENGGKVPKDKLMAYLQTEGRMNFTERRYGQESASAREVRRDQLHEIRSSIREEIDRLEEEDSPLTNTQASVLWDAVHELETSMSPIDILRHLKDARQDPAVEAIVERLKNVPREPSPTKHEDLVVPGGKNYREVIVGMPAEKPRVTFQENPASDRVGKWEVIHDGKVIYEGFKTREAAAAYADLQSRKLTPGNFRSSHFPEEPNYLAHYRANERPDPSGSPGFFVEEFQADRAQLGRKEGFVQSRHWAPEELSNLTVVRGPGPGTTVVEATLPDGRVVRVSRPTHRPISEEMARQIGKEGWTEKSGEVPDAPFRPSSAWGPMLFRRALRDAVEAGKKWIGWTTGETQNDRYDLSKHVSEIEIGHDADGYYYSAKPIDGEIGDLIERDQLSQKELARTLGDGLAAKAAADLTVDGPAKKYTGLDLKLGGEGMKKFYDDIMVKEVGKYVKQWDAKVEPGEIGRPPARIVEAGGDRYTIKVGDEVTSSRMTLEQAHESLARYRAAEGEQTPMWKVEITPAMEKGVKAGRQPMYSPDVGPRMNAEERLKSRDETRQLIDRSLAKNYLNTGGTTGVVLQSPEAKARIAGEAGYPEAGGVPHQVSAAEAQRLVDTARKDGFLWSHDAEDTLTEAFGRPGGGAEHDVWLVKDKTDPIVIRSRKVHIDDLGKLPTDTSPSRYLKRIEDYNTLFPELAMEVIGVSNDKNGDTKIWTAQPFVAGKEFTSYPPLNAAMERAGWEMVGKNSTVWRHKETGAVVEDAHLGNILHDKAGNIYPIDVIPVSMGKLEAASTAGRASPDVPAASVARHDLGVERETRKTGDPAAFVLSRKELKEIKKASIKMSGKKKNPEEIAANAAALEASIRETKARFPVEDGWKGPLEFTGLDPAGKPDYKVMPYEFNLGSNGKAMRKGTKAYDTQVSALASRMRDGVREIYDRAKAGSEAAQKILSQASWYREIRTRLRREFGGLGDLFADLLGATSPNTPVRTNWNFAVDSMRRALRGDFDHLIPQWEKWADDVDVLRDDLRTFVNQQLDAGRTKVSLEGKDAVTSKKTGKVTPAVPPDPVYQQKLDALKDLSKIGDSLLPTQESGANYGFNGRNVVRAMVDLWRTVRAPNKIMGEGGTAPKALNFSGNLIGFRPGATIDVWAARMLQRLAGMFRIPIPAEGSVSGRMLPSGETTHAFGMGQDVFAQATEMIRGDKELSTHDALKDVNPDDLQAIVWFLEKELWTKNNWTAQEGGSFELEADLAGISDQKRVVALRKIIDADKTTPEQKAKAQAELDEMKREADRYFAGLAMERSASLQGAAYVPSNADQARTAEQLHTAIYQSDHQNKVLGVKAASTEGRYGAVERAIDLELVARDGYDPNPLMDKMREIADREKQDTTFLARILRADETPDPLFHRAGVEIFFREQKTGQAMEAAIQKLHDMGAGFHTIVVDARRTTKSLAGEMPDAVGVRILRLPEYDVRFGMDKSWTTLDDAGIAKKVQQTYDELDALADDLMLNNPDVNLANAGYYEVRTEFAHEYAGHSNRPTQGTQGPTSGAPWTGRSVREAVDAANIRHGVPAAAP